MLSSNCGAYSSKKDYLKINIYSNTCILHEYKRRLLIANVTSSSNLLSKAKIILFISLDVGKIFVFLMKNIVSFLSKEL